MNHFMKAYCLIFILAFLFPNLIFSQNLFEAIIVDSEDRTPISYATIIYPEQQYGFSANAKGYFRIRFAEVERNKQIQITSIGYEMYAGVLGDMYDQNVDTIILKPKITFLKEVLVKAETETPREMIQSTAENLKFFLGKEPYNTNVYYTEIVKKNEKYVGYVEAHGMMHVAGYQPSFNRKNELFAYDLAQWKHLRRTQFLTPSCDNKRRTLSIYKLSKAKARYLYNGPLHKANFNDYQYTIDSLTTFDDNDVFIIGFRSLEGDMSGQIFVKTDDYALIALKVKETDASDTFDETCGVAHKSSFITSFTKVGDTYFFNTMELSVVYTSANEHVTEQMKLRSGEFNNNRTMDLNYDQRAVVYNEMINPSIGYEANFWLEQEKVPADLIADVAGNVPIEEQFKYNSLKRPIPLPDNYDSYEELYRNQDVFLLFVNDEF